MTDYKFIKFLKDKKMRISYNPLWKMLIDRGMNKKELDLLTEYLLD